MSSTYRVSHSYDPDFLTMAVPRLSSTTSLPHRRPVTPRQIKAGNKQLSSLQLTIHDPRSLMGLPRELRDEIFRLAVQDDINPTRETELVSRPGPTIKAPTQVSRNVRIEAASIYWSRTKFNYSTHNLLRDESLGDYRGRYKLRSWLSSWGRLAVPHIRRLKLKLPFNSGGLEIRLSKHTRPSIMAWTSQGLVAGANLKVIVTAELFPQSHSTMTPERLEKVCEILHKVGCMLSYPTNTVISWDLDAYIWWSHWHRRVQRSPSY